MSRWLPAWAMVSWAGLFIHNLADLPAHTISSSESLLPLLITVALVVAWFTPCRGAATAMMLAWALLNFAGAIVTVLPLAALPFSPEQSVLHYAFHLLYGLTQLPLIIAALLWLRHRRQGRVVRNPGRPVPPRGHG
ncbi:hypothetical protein ACFUCV_03170 [Specibacter sp. NPDC057265]|uniref:hypothetical protein n=1 Tax=Specibacter sp. NPDC057265 TaxID=3346075 RepID=UPI00362F1117